MGDTTPAGGRYTSLLADQLADERALKGTLEQRAIVVISTSGTLVAIVFGFVSLVTRTPGYAMPQAVVILLGCAFAVLIAASITGLLINLPVRMDVVDDAELAGAAEHPDWNVADPESSREEYRLQAALLIRLRRVNGLRARLLFLALVLEVLALGFMAVSVVLALRSLL
ncbi:hypothetical protein [Nonomuraea rhodomycinica]|uniref:Uncharacterized protein n=1 Tax=Nonomuraea rhodomycinica TaxID=1712872 RepID=A0A7Y6IM07_9ACTN|nr:hypothetical protein [Nonomuraea rhodomycinica]NUW40416.1 hypothetical protein [Nonomuraea rhodomycinica]